MNKIDENNHQFGGIIFIDSTCFYLIWVYISGYHPGLRHYWLTSSRAPNVGSFVPSSANDDLQAGNIGGTISRVHLNIKYP